MEYIKITELKKQFYFTREVKNNNSLATYLINNKIPVSIKLNASNIHTTYLTKDNYDKAYKLLEDAQYCKLCGNKFKVKTLRNKYCSEKCRNKVARDNFKNGSTRKRIKYKDTTNYSAEDLIDEFGSIE